MSRFEPWVVWRRVRCGYWVGYTGGGGGWEDCRMKRYDGTTSGVGAYADDDEDGRDDEVASADDDENDSDEGDDVE